MFAQLLYNFAVQSTVTGALLAVLNQDVPDFKQRLIAVLENTTHTSLTGNAMIDEAIDYVKSI